MIALDTHTHTVASGHGTTDTVGDLALEASRRGFSALAITDHGPAITGAAKAGYFRSLLLGNRTRFGVRLLFGCEVNILDERGKLDLDSETLQKLDFCIASLHPPCFRPASEAVNTETLLAAMKHPAISVIGHPNDVKYAVDLEALVLGAKRAHVMLELNNTSLAPDSYRGNVRAQAAELLRFCKRESVFVSLGSDSHGRAQVGQVQYCEELLRETRFPDELVANRTLERFLGLLK